ncbi:MAG: putative DNA-binding domain-containing protein [Polyangiaceae bacterium]|jgi:hypothetical protein|nr:putative DNA-binding domain-containing protein [Polyangiaceae bacterium]
MQLDATMRGLASVIRRHDSAKQLSSEPRAFLSEAGVEGADLEQMASLGDERLLVYRRLVFSRFVHVVETTIPRTRSRRGIEALHADVSRFLDEEASKSQYLRDIALEFVLWAERRWAEDDTIPGYLPYLARHEILSFEMAALQNDDRPVQEGELDLDRPVRTQASSRVVRYPYAVHELSTDPEDLSEPERRHTALLAYRDPSHRVRYLDLGPASAEMLEALVHRGERLRHAIAGGAHAAGVPMDDAYLGGVAALLADLAERGVLLGPEMGSG